MKTLFKKVLLVPLMLLLGGFPSSISSNTVRAQEETNLAYTATKTTNALGDADGIKDEAWQEAQLIDLVYARQFANENIGRMKIYMLWEWQ